MSFLNQLTTIIKYIALIGILAHILGTAPQMVPLGPLPYRTFSWEREGRVYEAMGIRRWKDRLPDKSKHTKENLHQADEGPRQHRRSCPLSPGNLCGRACPLVSAAPKASPVLRSHRV